jgi:hypothetical protein
MELNAKERRDMNWLVFSYSLPTKSRSSPRVALWRRLRRLGAITPAGGAQVLPAREDCLEAFQWLAQEIRQAHGEAVVMRVERFETLSDQRLVDLFNEARQADYAEIEAAAAELEKALGAQKGFIDRAHLTTETLEKLRRRQAEIGRVDYFDCPAGERVAAELDRLEQALRPKPAAPVAVAQVPMAAYRHKRWVTRPQPHVDRLACAWLIRRYINPKAVIRYAEQPKANEVAFDLEGVPFGHQGGRCSFETMLLAFGLDEPGLRALAELVHEIDLQDEQYARPEAPGVEVILQGWRTANLSDAELEARGLTLFEGLYTGLSGKAEVTRRIKPRRSKRSD